MFGLTQIQIAGIAMMVIAGAFVGWSAIAPRIARLRKPKATRLTPFAEYQADLDSLANAYEAALEENQQLTAELDAIRKVVTKAPEQPEVTK